MKVGVKVNAPVAPVRWSTVRDMALAAEDLGLDSVWSEDHHFEPFGGPWDVWSFLSAVAAVTSKVELGPIVASTAYYPSPVILARKAAAVDEISGGRLILGLGAGSGDFEYPKLGLPLDHPVSRFEEAFEIIRRLLAGERFSYEGRFHQLEDTWLSPVHRPIEGPDTGQPNYWLDQAWAAQPTTPLDIPILAGTLGSRMLSIMLPHVDGWNVHWTHRPFWNNPEAFPEVEETITESATSVDVDTSNLWSSAEIWMQFDGSRGLPMQAPDDLVPLSASVETLRRCAEAGIDHLIVLTDPQTPEAVQALASIVDDFRT